MSKDKGKDKDTPKVRGGRRRQKIVSEASLANLRKWQPGQSGNPSGRSKTLAEITREARELVPGAIQKLNEFVYDEDAPYRDRITAAIAICDRGLGKPVVPVYQGGGASPLEQTEDGAPMSALLRVARGSSDERALAELRAEVQRIEAKLAQEKQEREARLAEAAERLSRGEEIDGLTALLLHAKASNAERDTAAKAAPTRSAPATARLESKPDVFIADSAGNIAAPAPLAESATPTPEPPARVDIEKSASTPPAPPKAPPFQIEPDPTPAPTRSAPPKPAHPGLNMPGFGEFLSEKATREADAERAKKVEAARAQGQCQIPPSEAFPPDPREEPEIVNFTRIPGGRGIRRVG